MVALGGGIPATGAAVVIGEGFGKIMGQIGLVIVFGTIIGVFLERSGAALRIAELILKTFGKRSCPGHDPDRLLYFYPGFLRFSLHYSFIFA